MINENWKFMYFALAGWSVLPRRGSWKPLPSEVRITWRHGAEVVWRVPLGVAGATACYIVAAVLNFRFPVSQSSCIIDAPSFGAEPTQQQSRSIKCVCFMPQYSFPTGSAVRISFISQRSRLQRKFFLYRVQCEVWTCVNIELKQILPSSHSKLSLDT